MDTSEFGTRIVAAVDAQTGDSLRSVIGYTRDSYTVHYLRSDVERTYEDRNIERAVEELRLETLEEEYINNLFQEMHGNLDCRLDVFESAVEMNFAVGEGEGLEVAVDRSFFAKQDTLVGDILGTIDRYLDERD
jgi:hypothetical protein